MKKNVTIIFTCSLLLLQSYQGFSQLNSTINEFNKEDMEVARKVRRIQLDDPIRPVWHFTIAEGKALSPFDPNGAFFKDGIYHIFHIYTAEDDYWHWQHVSSIDLVHWRWYSHDLQPYEGDPERGISSGNAFIDKDKNVVFVYHGAGTKGTCVAKSYDDDFTSFQKAAANPIAMNGWADPHMWLENGTYYLLIGSEQQVKGATPKLFIGDTYNQPMKKMGDFMMYDMPDVDDFEDVSCPDFFKLEDKWVLICISHARGARYYIGEWDGKQFKPESHHRMNWPGGTYFAPETVLDDQGRRILLAWVVDKKEGYSTGMFSMPRILELADDKTSLNFAPPKEIEQLRYNSKQENPFTVEAGQSVTLNNIKGNIIELDITIAPGESKHFGIRVFCSKDGQEQTPIIIDREMNMIKINMNQSSLDNLEYNEFVMPWRHVLNGEPNPKTETMEAPFKLKKGENIRLQVFLDKSVLEVFANGRQCLTQVIYPTLEDAEHVQVFAEDAPIKVLKMQAWDLFPAMQW